MFKILLPLNAVLCVWLYCQTWSLVLLVFAPVSLGLLWALWYLPEYDGNSRVIPETFKHW